MVVALIALTSCQSPEQRVENAEDNVASAQEQLEEAKENKAIADREAAQQEEWRKFRAETDLKIQENEVRIAELRNKMKTAGNKMDAVYAAKIDDLEKRNVAIRKWLDDYEQSHSDWGAFKEEFNHDMDELGQALKDLAVDNKKQNP